MPEVIFKFDKERDLFNIWSTANSSSEWHDFKRGVTPNILKICDGRNFEDCKKELERIMKKVYLSGIIRIYTKAIQESWNNINDNFFKRLGKVMKKPINKKRFVGYITTAGRCPYDLEDYSFMVSLFFSLPQSLATTGHEIMHLQFHKYYWDIIEKEIGKEKTASLKESLTVLLNLEFNDFWFFIDKGYESHQELRSFISKTWKEERDFNVLVDKCIEYLKS